MSNNWAQNGARISKRDIVDLNQASEALATAAHTIQRINPQWGESVVALLIEANNTVVRIQQKGAAAFARYLERHGVKEAVAATETENPDEDANLDGEINQENE